jgi:hypothetical protein
MRSQTILFWLPAKPGRRADLLIGLMILIIIGVMSAAIYVH